MRWNLIFILKKKEEEKKLLNGENEKVEQWILFLLYILHLWEEEAFTFVNRKNWRGDDDGK